MAKISDYDMFDYDYSTYWKNRQYENLAEKNILDKLFELKKGNWFLDIGGSYGRLTSTYYESYMKPLILDYSLKTLQKNREILQSKYPNAELIAANAYKMPFKENVFDGGLMVRVLHHIERPENYFKEIARVMANESTYIQEFANKMHIKAQIKALLRGDFKFFSEEKYKQPTQHNNEGTKEGQEGVFYNFHIGHITKLLNKNGYTVKSKHGCSFLRSQQLKRFVNEEIMLNIEKLLQATLSWSNISPSILLESKLNKTENDKNTASELLEDILACPSCKGKLNFTTSDTCECKECSLHFEKKDGIWDFRVN